jgi:hypothetical protein
MSKLAVRLAAFLALALLAAGCADDEAADDSGADLPIERRVGFAVVVDDAGTDLMIALNEDRDAVSGEAFDVTQAIWRTEDGPWNEPPVTCLGLGQRVELGITQVQREDQPGLLHDHVVWISCLSPSEE